MTRENQRNADGAIGQLPTSTDGMQVQMMGQNGIELPKTQQYGVAHRIGCGDITRRVARHNKTNYDNMTVEQTTLIGHPYNLVMRYLGDHIGDLMYWDKMTEEEATLRVAGCVKVCSCLKPQGGKKAFMDSIQQVFRGN